MFHNRYYVPPGRLASGKNMSAMYKAMKRQLLKVYAQHQGYNTLTHKKEWKEKLLSDEQKADMLEDYRRGKIEEWERFGDKAYLPDAWLAFLLCSYPMEVYFPSKKMTLDCLVPPEVVQPENMQLPSKAVRRAERLTAAKTRGTASSTAIPITESTLPLKPEVTKTFVVLHKKEEGSHVDTVIAGLEREQVQLESNLRFLESHGGDPAAIRLLNARIMKVIVALTKLQSHHMDSLMNKDQQIAKIINQTEDVVVEELPNRNLFSSPANIHGTPSTSTSSQSGFILPSTTAIPSAPAPLSNTRPPSGEALKQLILNDPSTQNWIQQTRKRVMNETENQPSLRKRGGSALTIHSPVQLEEESEEEFNDEYDFDT
jgi:hypothetical protein